MGKLDWDVSDIQSCAVLKYEPGPEWDAGFPLHARGFLDMHIS